jgi:hypothetical protein
MVQRERTDMQLQSPRIAGKNDQRVHYPLRQRRGTLPRVEDFNLCFMRKLCYNFTIVEFSGKGR